MIKRLCLVLTLSILSVTTARADILSVANLCLDPDLNAGNGLAAGLKAAGASAAAEQHHALMAEAVALMDMFNRLDDRPPSPLAVANERGRIDAHIAEGRAGLAVLPGGAVLYWDRVPVDGQIDLECFFAGSGAEPLMAIDQTPLSDVAETSDIAAGPHKLRQTSMRVGFEWAFATVADLDLQALEDGMKDRVGVTSFVATSITVPMLSPAGK